MNPSQTRVIDPILSKFARGYVQSNFVGSLIFPRVPVVAYGGRVIEFGKESFKLVNTRRAPGGATKRIKFGYEGKPYAIVPSALEAKVPRELMRDASQVPGIDLASRSIAVVKDVMDLSHEYECASLALDPNNYGNNNKLSYARSDSWAVDSSDPKKDIDEASEAIRASTGRKPNLLTVSPLALSALKSHPKLIERFKYAVGGRLTLQQLQEILEIEQIVEGDAIVAGVDDAFGDVWRKDAHLCYRDKSPSPSHEVPSFGYTYFIEGHPLVEKPYWDANAKSWIYGVSDDNAPVIAGSGAGFLFQNAGLRG